MVLIEDQRKQHIAIIRITLGNRWALKMNKKEVKRFISTHRDIEISAAKFEYSLFLYDGVDRAIFKELDKADISEEEVRAASMISEAIEGEELLKLMRKPMSGLNKYNLRQKILENEEAVIRSIQKTCLTNRQDIFIENALYFFLRCEENVSDWFVENYALYKSEYLKSMFCLILGFRGREDHIPFLIGEAERFEAQYPNETYDQGPALAVNELFCRFYS